MDVLIYRKTGVFDVVSHSEITVGEEFVYGYDSNTNRPIKRRVL